MSYTLDNNQINYDQERSEIEIINRITKMHIIMFLVYSFFLVIYISIHMFILSGDLGLCENNASRFCPLIQDSTGIVNKPNPNASVSY